jgi:hypothetical protein
MIEFVSTTIIICGFFVIVCGVYYLKDKYYRDNYYETRAPHYTSYKPLNDSYSEHI